MSPAPFSYARPNSLQEASSLLKADRVAILAGGQSLLTELKQRRRRVDLLVDLAGLGLTQITKTETGVRVDAMVCQTTLMSDLKDGPFHLIYETGMTVADPSVRSRGTFVGALMAAEPQGDWAATALALDAHLLISDGSRERRVPYCEWLASNRRLRPGELTIAAELMTTPGRRSFRIPRKLSKLRSDGALPAWLMLQHPVIRDLLLPERCNIRRASTRSSNIWRLEKAHLMLHSAKILRR